MMKTFLAACVLVLALAAPALAAAPTASFSVEASTGTATFTVDPGRVRDLSVHLRCGALRSVVYDQTRSVQDADPDTGLVPPVTFTGILPTFYQGGVVWTTTCTGTLLNSHGRVYDTTEPFTVL